jgi:hypothetical protein
VDQVGVARAADRIAARVEPSARKELQQLLGLFENGLAGFILGGRTRPFTRLDGAEQDAVLAEWRDSRIAVRRTGHAALRTLVLAGYYQSPAVWPPMGYGGPPRIFEDGPSLPSGAGVTSRVPTATAFGTGSRCHEHGGADPHRPRPRGEHHPPL